ncbi:MAG: hypothetical protein HC924_17670 [Synechococcaceae cyanobacterium SM2_3_2]|nr:hypothetical protein [Synechococcaceae cyanobacterium SM2_3_2]
MASLEQKLSALSAKIDHLQNCLVMLGITGEKFVSLAEATKLLGKSQDHLRRQCVKAERARILGEPCAWKYGVHYRNEADPGAERAEWFINPVAINKLMNLPPEKRI